MSSIRSMIDNSTDINFVKDAAKIILEDNQRQARRIAELEELKRQIDEQREFENEELKKRLKRVHKNQFKKGREAVSERERKTQEDEVLLHAQSLCGKKPKAESWSIPSSEETHKSEEKTIFALAQKRDPLLTKEDCEIREVEGLYESSTEITVVERSYKKIVHRRQKYRVTNKKTGKALLITAPGPMKLLPQCRYSLDFAVSVAAEKYLDHLPYERQRRRMKRKGLKIDVKTLSRLTEMVGLHCNVIVPEILKEIFEVNLSLHLDETPWPILSKKDSNGYMWVISNQAGSCYFFEPTRSGEVPKALLKDYKGSVLTDGYQGYLFLRSKQNINWACCWAHLRRKFYDLREDEPEDAKMILEMIDDLFEIEREAKNWGQLKVLRKEKSSPLIQKIEGWLIKKRGEYFPQSSMREAIDYGLKYWLEFKIFLKDETLPLSNNDAERALRHSVLGRKNFHGSKTINGADTAATLYTVIESCKKAELDPEEYLKYLITCVNSDKKPLTPLALAKKQNQG